MEAPWENLRNPIPYSPREITTRKFQRRLSKSSLRLSKLSQSRRKSHETVNCYIWNSRSSIVERRDSASASADRSRAGRQTKPTVAPATRSRGWQHSDSGGVLAVFDLCRRLAGICRCYHYGIRHGTWRGLLGHTPPGNRQPVSLLPVSAGCRKTL